MNNVQVKFSRKGLIDENGEWLLDEDGDHIDEDDSRWASLPVIEFVATVSLGECNEYGCDDSVLTISANGEVWFDKKQGYAEQMKSFQSKYHKALGFHFYASDDANQIIRKAREQ